MNQRIGLLCSLAFLIPGVVALGDAAQDKINASKQQAKKLEEQRVETHIEDQHVEDQREEDRRVERKLENDRWDRAHNRLIADPILDHNNMLREEDKKFQEKQDIMNQQHEQIQQKHEIEFQKKSQVEDLHIKNQPLEDRRIEHKSDDELLKQSPHLIADAALLDHEDYQREQDQEFQQSQEQFNSENEQEEQQNENEFQQESNQDDSSLNGNDPLNEK